MEVNIERGTKNAYDYIIKHGLQQYFNDGVRFGFFEGDDDIIEIGNEILERLVGFQEYEMAEKLRDILMNNK